MDTEEAARRWAHVLRTAWAGGGVGGFVDLYAEGAEFRGPFGEPEAAAGHMRVSLTLGEPGPSVWVGAPLVHGDRVAVEWWAVIVVDGEPISFAATSWLRFDGDGRVADEHDYWMSTAGRREPWPGWA